MSTDFLLIGAHPDDVEWGAGGMCLLLKMKQISFAIADLTQGELGSRGTPEIRQKEAALAADRLGAASRESLKMPDGQLTDTPESRMRVASLIRRFRPNVVVSPFWRDRHPDHAAAGAMVRNSLLYCALRKTDDPYPPHKPALFLYYLLHHFERPSLVIDISAGYPEKLSVLRLHNSQFSQTACQFGVIPLGLNDYLYGLESRDRFYGSLIGVTHGEAFVLNTPLTPGQAAILAQLRAES